MGKTAKIQARVDEDLKSETQEILSDLGLSMSEAVNLFLSLVRLHKGLPFAVRIPNEETLEAMRELDEKPLVAQNSEELFKELGI